MRASYTLLVEDELQKEIKAATVRINSDLDVNNSNQTCRKFLEVALVLIAGSEFETAKNVLMSRMSGSKVTITLGSEANYLLGVVHTNLGETNEAYAAFIRAARHG
ncbi:unnamed protein product, partial [marine sediment metagenome]